MTASARRGHSPADGARGTGFRHGDGSGGSDGAIGPSTTVVMNAPSSRRIELGAGFGDSSVNAVIFRKNSIVTFGDRQFVAWYDSAGRVTLAVRVLGTGERLVRSTSLHADVTDAHRSISLMVDGSGHLHVAWGHHADGLRYARTLVPGTLELGDAEPMLGRDEDAVTYPEFHRLPDGDMLFAYRDGTSGDGDLVLNRYRTVPRTWRRLQSGLLDGERARNAYWQLCVDGNGAVHLSWVWRESTDASTNHDLCHARSDDGGSSWRSLDGEPLELPITRDSCAPVWPIPQGSNLMNQTSMTVDRSGRPYIATYFLAADSPVTQIRVVHHDGRRWRVSRVSERATDFSLSGNGTRSLPISRPQILLDETASGTSLLVIYRDDERGGCPVVARGRVDEGSGAIGAWEHAVLDGHPTGRWEPTFDTELWRNERRLHLFLQAVEQPDGDESGPTEGTSAVSILEVELRA